jgi:hypothetical protein
MLYFQLTPMLHEYIIGANAAAAVAVAVDIDGDMYSVMRLFF